MTTIQRDFNPNYQDMAVLGAARAYKDWQTANGMADASADDGEGGDSDGAAVPAPAQPDGDGEPKDYTDRELQALEDEDPLSLIDSLASRVGPATPAGVGSSTCSDPFRANDWN